MAGTDLNAIITRIAAQGVRNVAADPDVPNIAPEQAPAVTRALVAQVNASPEVHAAAEAVKQATTPIVWYQSGVVMGQVVAVLSMMSYLVFGKVLSTGDQAVIIEGLTGLGTVIGVLITLHGRLTSKAEPVVLTAPK